MDKSFPWIKPYGCKICKKRYAHHCKLKRHMLSHTRPLACNVCGKRFDVQQTLQRHMLTHTGEKPYDCPVCGQAFHSQDSVNKHMASRHTGERHECEQCGKKYRRKDSLKAHMRVHNGEELFSCTICERPFTQRFLLKAHMKIHANVKPHVCEVCNKGFSKKGQLTTHMWSHTGQKPYDCQLCFKTFTCQNDFNKHMLSHGIERPYFCNICSKGFKKSAHLSKHRETHLVDKPLECGICKKRFINLRSLRTHIFQQHTRGIPYACEDCNESFSEKEHLEKHMRKHEIYLSSKYNTRTVKRYSVPLTSAMKESRCSETPVTSRFVEDTVVKTEYLDTEFDAQATNEDSQLVQNPEKSLFISAAVINTSAETKETLPDSNCDVLTVGEISIKEENLVSEFIVHAGNDEGRMITVPRNSLSKSSGVIDGSDSMEVTGSPGSSCVGELTVESRSSFKVAKKTPGGEGPEDSETSSDVNCSHSSTQIKLLSSKQIVRRGDHACALCERIFTSKMYLERHMLSHFDEKPFECGLCQEGFVTMEDFEKHLFTHIG